MELPARSKRVIYGSTTLPAPFLMFLVPSFINFKLSSLHSIATSTNWCGLHWPLWGRVKHLLWEVEGRLAGGTASVPASHALAVRHPNNMRTIIKGHSLKGHQPQWVFYFLFLILNIWVQSSEALHTKMNPTSCLFGSRFAYAQTSIFFAEQYSKNGRDINCSLDYGSWIKSSNIPRSNPNPK